MQLGLQLYGGSLGLWSVRRTTRRPLVGKPRGMACRCVARRNRSHCFFFSSDSVFLPLANGVTLRFLLEVATVQLSSWCVGSLSSSLACDISMLLSRKIRRNLKERRNLYFFLVYTLIRHFWALAVTVRDWGSYNIFTFDDICSFFVCHPSLSPLPCRHTWPLLRF